MKGKSGSYDERLEHRMDKESIGSYLFVRMLAEDMQKKYPIGSKRQIYYQDDSPWVTQLAYSSYFTRFKSFGLLN